MMLLLLASCSSKPKTIKYQVFDERDNKYQFEFKDLKIYTYDNDYVFSFDVDCPNRLNGGIFSKPQELCRVFFTTFDNDDYYNIFVPSSAVEKENSFSLSFWKEDEQGIDIIIDKKDFKISGEFDGELTSFNRDDENESTPNIEKTTFQRYEIDYSRIGNKYFEVLNLDISKVETGYEINLDIDQNGFSKGRAFDPPEGMIYREFLNVSKGNSFSFIIPFDKFDQMDELTLMFSNNEDDNEAFVSLATADIIDYLNNK